MEENPYRPPDAKLVDESAVIQAELADRGQRFGAALLDGLIGMMFGIPILFAVGSYDYIRRGQSPPWLLTLAASTLGLLMFLLVHGYYLKRGGQTIGKKVVGIRITDLDNNVPQFARLIGLRYLPIRLAGLIPFIGPLYGLIDVLFIFREDRRCLHDLIAGTKVVKIQ